MPQRIVQSPASGIMLHKLHRTSACIIAAFAAVHLLNHLLALQSVEAHIQFMESFRLIYRNMVVEVVLLACVAFQVTSGIFLIKKRWGQRCGFFEHAQAISGGFLVYFLLVHVGSVLVGRTVLKLDTNFYFAAAGMHVPRFPYYFIPYYFLFVVAVFVHIACAASWLTKGKLGDVSRKYMSYAIVAIGVLIAALIVATFAGEFYDITIPQEYRATYQ